MTDATATTSSPFTPELIASVFNDGTPPEETPDVTPEQADPEPAKADGETAAPAEAPKDKSVAERLAAALKAEKKAAELRAKNEAKARELEAREKTITPRESDAELFARDPAEYIAKKGWGQKEIAAFLDKLAGTYKPEAESEKKLTSVEQKVQELEARLAEKEALERARSLTVAQQEAGKGFVQHIASAADKYLHLTEYYSDEEAVQAGFAVLNEVIGQDAEGKPVTRVRAFEAQHGRTPTDEELAEHLDAIAKAKLEARAKSSWRKGAATNQVSQANGEASAVPPAKGTSPRTLSRADTSERAAAPRQTGWTQELADQKSLEILARGMKR